MVRISFTEHDDKKEKHQSYEINFTIHLNPNQSKELTGMCGFGSYDHTLESTVYGKDKDEARINARKYLIDLSEMFSDEIRVNVFEAFVIEHFSVAKTGAKFPPNTAPGINKLWRGSEEVLKRENRLYCYTAPDIVSMFETEWSIDKMEKRFLTSITLAISLTTRKFDQTKESIVATQTRRIVTDAFLGWCADNRDTLDQNEKLKEVVRDCFNTRCDAFIEHIERFITRYCM